MQEVRVVKDLNVSIQRETVLHMMDCYPDSPIYDEVLEEYEAVVEEMEGLCEPAAVIAYGTLPAEIATEEYPEGTEVLYMISTVGGGVSDRSTEAFRSGDCLKGMLLDAIADSALFSLEGQLQMQIQEICAQLGKGIRRRLEAPQDIPMESQKTAFCETKAGELLGLRITSGYMLDPVKSNCQIFILSDDKTLFKTQHDCRKCSNLTCKLRNIPPCEVTVRENNHTYVIQVPEKTSLLEALISHGKYFSAVCGGKGNCGKCKVRVLEGECPVTPEDQKSLTEAEIADGWRLSCKAYPVQDLTIEVGLRDESDFSIISDYQTNEEKEEIISENDTEYGIAIDIGTTTIALLLVGLSGGKIYKSHTRINHQRAYGADVISRIQASVSGKKKELQKSIQLDLTEGIKELLKETRLSARMVKKVVIAGNTTMIHLLMGYDCDSLGVFPFTPVNINEIKSDAKQILGNDLLSCTVVIFPGISTYVGGDIVSGIYGLRMAEEEAVTLLVDLGTNGEMAIGNKESILVTSTAAGPAFEGGNISCGMGSVAGAISNVEIQNGEVRIQTIGEKPPAGLCGTGVVETVSELLREGLVDETGLLDEDYFDDGFELAQTPQGESVVFTQQDVREIQLAKAAVRAGIETLLCRKGLSYQSVDRVCIAGGFGFKLDHEKAVAIGMLPKEFRKKVQAVGNSSLQGAVRYLLEVKAREDVSGICSISSEINLSADKEFNEFYMEHMMFES